MEQILMASQLPIDAFSNKTRQCIANLVDFFRKSKDEQGHRAAYINGVEPYTRLAAVLVVLFERDGALRVLVTTRGEKLKTHGGQTSLPGGKMDAEDNRNIITTAYREAYEEVALPRNCPHIYTLGTLDLHPFHKLVVTPVVAVLTDASVLDKLVPREGEVDHIFSHPVEAFLNPSLAADLEPLVPHGSKYWPHESKYHHYSDHVIKDLGGTTYRWHFFQTSASPVTGLTADVMIRVAEIAYQREADFERYAYDQIRSSQEWVEAFEEKYQKALALQ